MTALAPQVPVKIPVKLLPILHPRRFKIMHGGRGGAKSHTVAQVLLAMGMQRKMRILCGREVQKSLKESSQQLLLDYIDRMGLQGYYRLVNGQIVGCNGTVFTFTGLRAHTATSIKSFEGYDLVWVEEAQSVSEHSWNLLIPTILRTDGAEIWATFNSDSEDDYVYRRFVKNTDIDALVIEINWRDNPWFNEAMNEERLKMKALNDDLYQHIWEGKPRSVSGLLFKRDWFKRRYDKVPQDLSKYLASDYAVSTDGGDWTEHGVPALDSSGDMYFIDWWSGQTAPDVWIRSAVRLIKEHKPQLWFEEKGVILRAVDGAIAKSLRENNAYVMRQPLASAGNKAERALGFAARASLGAVWLPETEWSERLVNQLCSFTGEPGRTDDMVDVCSLAARGLSKMWNAPSSDTRKRRRVEPFRREWLEGLNHDDDQEKNERANYYT